MYKAVCWKGFYESLEEFWNAATLNIFWNMICVYQDKCMYNTPTSTNIFLLKNKTFSNKIYGNILNTKSTFIIQVRV